MTLKGQTGADSNITTKENNHITKLEQQLLDARSEIAKLYDDLYKAHEYIERQAREKRTGKIRIYVKGLLNETLFMYKMGDLYADIIYEDGQYIKLDGVGDRKQQHQHSYNYLSQHKGDIV